MQTQQTHNVSLKERMDTERFWREHLGRLAEEGVLQDANLRSWLYASTYHGNIGFEGRGQVRPHELGKWDLFFPMWQEWRLSKEDACKIANLTINEVEEELKRDRERM